MADDGRLRLLYVEDDPINRALLRAALQRAGDQRLAQAELSEAGSLSTARELLAQGPFDALLLDRRLPDGDGFTLAAELRATGATTLIIALTADAVPATHQAALDAGCNSVVTKPYLPADLLALLSSRLGGAAS